MNTETRPPNAADDQGSLKPFPLRQQLISIFSLAAEATDEQIVVAVKKLKSSAKRTVALTEFEKKVHARMDRGQISRAAAELAQKSQDSEDQRRAVVRKK